MKALVLSAGKGERLMPLTATVPKPIIEVGGRPLIHYPLKMLAAAGVRDVAVNVHHLASVIQDTLGDGSALGLRITYAPEPALLGTGGPLPGLRDFFGDETFAILNCDTIIDLDLRLLERFHREGCALATMVLRDNPSPQMYSRIEIDSSASVRRMCLLMSRTPPRFEEYGTALDAVHAAALDTYMYCGVLLCEPSLFELMPEIAPPFSLVSDLLAPMLTRGAALRGYVHRGWFRTVDDLPSLEALRAELASSPPRLGFL
jgi:NDP-sugar pyrophosphorylase family protein